MNFTALFTVIIAVLVIVYVYVTIHIIKKQSAELLNAKTSLKKLTDENTALETELKNLHNATKKKEEVENETKQNLADIASGSTDASVDRLQHPEKRRKPKSTSKNSNS